MIIASRLRSYWTFYWPLALYGAASVLALQLQNATLARYADAAHEIATFALAMSTFGFFNAALNFTPQLTNVYARSPGGQRRTHGFVATASLLLAAPLLALALTPLGPGFLRFAFDVRPRMENGVLTYLALLCPMLLINAQRHFYSGLLIQSRRTRTVTALNMLFLASMLGLLFTGFQLGWPPPIVLMSALLTSAMGHAVLLRTAVAFWYVPPSETEHESVTWRELAAFFLPVTTTGVMFALSRPVLYAWVARTPDAVVSIAALRVGFDFSMLFQQAANQFRHFFVTFGLDDLAYKRRFMAIIGASITAFMLLIALTPAGDALLGGALGIRGEVGSRAQDVILVMTALPAVIITRNYFHGILMVRRQTLGMAFGSGLRVAAVYFAGLALYSAGWLDHRSAAVAFLLGMVIEMLVVLRAAAQSVETVAARASKC